MSGGRAKLRGGEMSLKPAACLTDCEHTDWTANTWLGTKAAEAKLDRQGLSTYPKCVPASYTTALLRLVFHFLPLPYT
jgi:hypothetical protein